jgi:hypothetical protein
MFSPESVKSAYCPVESILPADAAPELGLPELSEFMRENTPELFVNRTNAVEVIVSNPGRVLPPASPGGVCRNDTIEPLYERVGREECP